MTVKGYGWLIIWRKLRESIMIGKDVEVSVSKIEGNRVWIAVKAPSGVTVHRKEKPKLAALPQDEDDSPPAA